MSNQNICRDFYGEKLKIGDEVIPVISEALLIGISGIISKINYNEDYDNYYITIVAEDGTVLLDSVDSEYYTTQARFDERERQNNVYNLTFYNSDFLPITSLPLTNKTDEDYEMPEDTCLVLLKAEYLTEKNSCSNTYIIYTIYNYFIDKDIELCSMDDYFYLRNDKYDWYPVHGDYEVLNKDNLKKQVNKIIKFFKETDLSKVNNTIYKKEDINTFEKKILKKIKQSNN